MDSQSEQEPQGLEGAENGGDRFGRIRRAFGFLKSPTFWGGLLVGLAALGVGIALGLGAGRWFDDDRGHGDRGRESAYSDEAWAEKGWYEKGRPERGEWQDGWKGRGPMAGGGFDQGIQVPDQIWDRIDSILEKVEEMVERAADYLEEGDGFGGFWDRNDGMFSGRGAEGFLDPDSGFWEEGALGGFAFPFPGLAFLEECDLNIEALPDLMESLSELEEENGDTSDPDEFFGQLEGLLAEICQSPLG